MVIYTRYCNFYQPSYTIDEKIEIIEKLYEEDIGICEFCMNHNLRKSTVGEWKMLYDKMKGNGVILFRDKTGREKELDNTNRKANSILREANKQIKEREKKEKVDYKAWFDTLSAPEKKIERKRVRDAKTELIVHV